MRDDKQRQATATVWACLGGLRGAEEWGFDGGGEADELGEGVVAEVSDPEVSAGVDGDGEGFEHGRVGGPAGGGGKGLAGVGRDRAG